MEVPGGGAGWMHGQMDVCWPVELMERSRSMVLLSRMQLDEMGREEMLLQEARKARLAEEAAGGRIKAAGSPKVQSQFFLRRFGKLARRG